MFFCTPLFWRFFSEALVSYSLTGVHISSTVIQILLKVNDRVGLNIRLNLTCLHIIVNIYKHLA